MLIRGGSFPRYSASGHIVYGVADTLWAVGFDLDRLDVTTNRVPVLDGVITEGTGAADFAFSSDGSLVYVTGAGGEDLTEGTLVWVNRDGRGSSRSRMTRSSILAISACRPMATAWR